MKKIQKKSYAHVENNLYFDYYFMRARKMGQNVFPRKFLIWNPICNFNRAVHEWGRPKMEGRGAKMGAHFWLKTTQKCQK